MQFKKDKMSPNAQKAKLSVLKDLHKQASDAMTGDLKGMKKVTVAADSKDGLKEGLEKAEDMLGMENEDEGEDREYDSADKALGEQSEGFEDQQDESEPMDEEEIEAKIQELLALKEKLQK